MKSILCDGEFMRQNANALSKSHPKSFHWAFVWVINMSFQSRLFAKWTLKSFLTHSFLALQMATLQAPQHLWQHDKVGTNNIGQWTDFPGPIKVELSLLNSWHSPAKQGWSRPSYVITRPVCHKCLNVYLIKVSDITSLPFFIPTKQHPDTSSAGGPPWPHRVFLRGTHLNYKNPGTELLFH